MKGAKGVLINITGGYDMTLFEVDEAANEVRREVDVDAPVILGSTFDELGPPEQQGPQRVWSSSGSPPDCSRAYSARPSPCGNSRPG